MPAELQLLRTLAAPPERIWRALTDPAALAAWFWPARLAPTAEVDRVEAGGRYRITSSAAGMAVAGGYVAVERPRRLELTWNWDGEAEETRVTIELAPVEGGTGLSLRHEGFADDATRDDHVQGWSDCLDRLPGWLDSPA